MAGLLLAQEEARRQNSVAQTPDSPILLPNSVSVPFRTLNTTKATYFSRARHLHFRRKCCCSRWCNTKKENTFAVRDFRYIYDYVESVHLTQRQKQLLLVRFTMIMEKVKHKLAIYTTWHTCTKTCLIIGNILVPSFLSVEALFFNIDTVRQIVFWFVWVLSIVIALISSFVTFCNTQKKYNLYNQFSTKIQREMWAYLTLSGRYMVMEHHLSLLRNDLVKRQKDDQLTFTLSDEEEEDEVGDIEEEGPTTIGDEEGEPTPVDLFEDVTYFNVEQVPTIMNQGHMLHFQAFMNRLETLYRYLTNSNIDIEVEDMSNLDFNNTTAATRKQQQQQQQQQHVG